MSTTVRSADAYALIAANPFPGLRAFKPGEADRFFGRQQQIDELVARHRADRVEHALVGDRVVARRTGTQPVDESVAHALAGEATADVGRLQAHPCNHFAGSSVVERPPTQLATCSSAW